MNEVNRELRQALCDGQAFFYRTFFVVHAVEGHLDGYRIIRAACLADLFQYLKEETRTVLKAAAVLIGTVIPLGRRELVYEISAVCVDFDDVNSSIFCQLCALAYRLHQLLYPFRRHLATDEIRLVVVRDRAR